jgi:hypothetical protein
MEEDPSGYQARFLDCFSGNNLFSNSARYRKNPFASP